MSTARRFSRRASRIPAEPPHLLARPRGAPSSARNLTHDHATREGASYGGGGRGPVARSGPSPPPPHDAPSPEHARELTFETPPIKNACALTSTTNRFPEVHVGRQARRSLERGNDHRSASLRGSMSGGRRGRILNAATIVGTRQPPLRAVGPMSHATREGAAGGGGGRGPVARSGPSPPPPHDAPSPEHARALTFETPPLEHARALMFETPPNEYCVTRETREPRQPARRRRGPPRATPSPPARCRESGPSGTDAASARGRARSGSSGASSAA